MATADKLLEQIYSWMEQRENSAEKLKKLAQELESLRGTCSGLECVGSSVAVTGAACLLGAGLSVLTAGAAAPFLGLLGAAYTGVGAAISIGTKITEHFMSSGTLKEAQEIEEKCNKIGEKIKELFKDLKAQSPDSDPDEEDQYVMSEMMGAMARRSGLSDFNPYFLYEDHDLYFNGGQMSMRPNQLIKGAMIAGLIGIMAFFTFKVNGKKFKFLLAKGTEQLLKKMSTTGFKTFLKGSAMVVGGLVGLAFSLPEAIDNWKELTKKNHVTEASKSLRDTADSFLKATRALREQLEEIKKHFEMLRKVKLCISNPKRTCQDKKMLIEFAIDHCHEEDVKQWLKENAGSEAFFRLVDVFHLLEKEMKKRDDEEEKKKKKKPCKETDIIFVAHGGITDTMIPATCLLPLPSIKDVLLYSPWNCAIDANVAYGIAAGRIEPRHRKFCCAEEKCEIPDQNHWPTNLPNNWNNMKKAGGALIPNIIVSPVGLEGDKVWDFIMYLIDKHGLPDKSRVIIPFILPGNIDVDVPFYVVTLALSLVLFFTGCKATVHLAACLSKVSEDTELDVSHLDEQYSCTVDETAMICSPDEFPKLDTRMYRLLKSVFG